MRKIAIVDDEQEERDSLQECFEQFQKENAIKLEIKTYCSGDVFLQQFDASYDLICLDIDMDGTNGIDTAKKIRQKDKEVLIFFVTNMAQMAIRGYEVRALDFIIKPVNYYSFAMKLLNAYEELDKQDMQGENIKTAKSEIENTLDTINVAFENLLDSFYKETAWDVSSDISVLKTMFAQEGLTEKNNFQGKDN